MLWEVSLASAFRVWSAMEAFGCRPVGPHCDLDAGESGGLRQQSSWSCPRSGWVVSERRLREHASRDRRAQYVGTAVFGAIIGGTTTQAADQLRNRAALAGALARPINHAQYENADLALQASTLAHGIAETQPFIDGNKRVALVMMLTFLELNGSRVQASDRELADWINRLQRWHVAARDCRGRSRAPHGRRVKACPQPCPELGNSDLTQPARAAAIACPLRARKGQPAAAAESRGRKHESVGENQSRVPSHKSVIAIR